MRHLPTDPIRVINILWPRVIIYPKQEDIIYSVKENDETFVPAGNMLGKDFVAGLIALGGFLYPEAFLHPGNIPYPSKREVRIVTTSVKDDHLRVLWGEIGRFIQTCRFPLDSKRGGPLIINHRDIRKVDPITKQLCPISYLRGMVSEQGEGMAGHHAAYTLVLGDEASGLSDLVYTQSATWARKGLFIGNPNECSNFFRRAVKEGDVLAK